MNHAQRNDVLEKTHAVLAELKQRPVDAYEVKAYVESGFTATARMGDVENLEHHREIGLTVTVYKDQRCGSAATSDLSSAVLRQTVEKACSIAKYTQADPFAGIAQKSAMAYGYPDLDLYHPWDISPEKAIELALACDNRARACDSRIAQTEEAVVTTSNSYSVYANANEFIGDYSSSLHGLSLSVIAKEHGVMERDYDYRYSHRPEELMTPENLAHSAVDKVIHRLNARKISTRQCPVIFEARVARSLLGHFVNAISGGSLYRKTSFLVDHLGKTVFPKFVSIYQRPHLLAAYGSTPFDQQGVKTQDLDYVSDGELTHYVLGHYAAKKLGMTTTGNAGGVFNLFISHSDKDLAALCREIGSGLLVTEVMGQGVNLLTGNYSRGASGFWIENGEIQYPVHEVTIAANLKDMFAGILAVGNDVNPYSNIRTGSIAIEKMTVAGS